MNDNWDTLNSKQAYIELEKAKNNWADWQEKVIVLSEGLKATLAKCFLKHKPFVKTATEAENLARIDKEYQEAVKSLAYAEGMLIKTRYAYNNLDRYISFKQTELKLDVALTNKQQG